MRATNQAPNLIMFDFEDLQHMFRLQELVLKWFDFGACKYLIDTNLFYITV